MMDALMIAIALGPLRTGDYLRSRHRTVVRET